MFHTTCSGTTTPPTPLEVRVSGPASDPLLDGDLRRLFPGGALTHDRLDRLRAWPRVSVWCGDRLVAVATCEQGEGELRVAEVGFDLSCGCSHREMFGVLAGALEVAALAGGHRRVTVNPPRTALPFFEDRGYARATTCRAAGWVQKTLL